MSCDYDGWAPCVHKDEDTAKAIQLIKDVTPSFSETIEEPWKSVQGGILEDMIFQISDLSQRGDIRMDVDQWWGVWVEGQIKDQKCKTQVQGDTLLLAVAETLRWWRAKWKEIHGEESA